MAEIILKSFQFRQSCFQGDAARCRRHQGVVDIGKVRTGPWEVTVAIGGDFPPIGLQSSLAGERKPPQQRSCVRKDVQWRIRGIRWSDVLLVDSKRTVQITGIECTQRDVPAKVSVQEAGAFMCRQPAGKKPAARCHVALLE